MAHPRASQLRNRILQSYVGRDGGNHDLYHMEAGGFRCVRRVASGADSYPLTGTCLPGQHAPARKTHIRIPPLCEDVPLGAPIAPEVRMPKTHMLTIALACALVSSAVAHAEIISIEQLLLPRRIADRVAGSGVESRSVAAQGSPAYRVSLATLRVQVSERIAMRAALGLSCHRAVALAQEESGTAVSAGIAFWRRAGLSLGIELTGMRLGYEGGTVIDGSAVLALRGR